MKTNTTDEGRTRKDKITRHTDLEVYQRAFAVAMEIFRLSKAFPKERAFAVAMEIFRLSKAFPKEEQYSLTDQVRRSSRSVAANISEGWRKRRYAASFVSKLNDSEGEAGETQTWLQFAVECGYLDREATRKLYADYDSIIGMLVNMQNHPEVWSLTKRTVGK